jgi:hypothetical protein
MDRELSDVTGGKNRSPHCQFLQFPASARFIQNCFAQLSHDWSSAMTSPTETALTLVVVKSFAIVGSAFATVLFFAFVGTKRR